jgi:hypothetical protein
MPHLCFVVDFQLAALFSDLFEVSDQVQKIVKGKSC